MTNIFPQNLVPNPGFEDYTNCPTGINGDWPLECTPWQSGNLATPDYYNVCADGTDAWIPDNWVGTQEAHTGEGYVGCIWKWNYPDWQEYVQVQLTEPCIAGFSYEISFYVSLADFYCGIENIGAYFSESAPPLVTSGPLDFVPQFESDLGFVSDDDNWVLISGCFPAAGGEQWITIGNFYSPDDTPTDPDCSISTESYYYIDDVSVTLGDPTETLDLDLGENVTSCVPYEIDPGVTGVTYHWSDGSTEPTLIVNESGMYFLTITIGCSAVGVDSVEVTIDGVPEVDLGPPEVTICDGDAYTISLDPESGDYIWQDGSTDYEYSITTAGTYSVSMDDGCDVTTDDITVFVLDIPDPFSLGDDTYLCPGDEIIFSFDTDLGDFLWQDGSTSSSYTIDEAGDYALTISNICGAFSDDIEVLEILPPEVDLGPSQLTICDGDILEIDLDPDSGEFLWQDGSMSSSYSISLPGTYAVTVTNECGTITDEITVFVMDDPSPFSLGNDTSFCTGNTIVYSFDPGLGDFEWQDGSTSPDYTIYTGGIYELTISNQCGEYSDTIEIIEIIPPEIDLGPDQLTLCDGQTFYYDFDPDLGDYMWQDGSTSASYTILLADYYSVTVTNVCGTSSDQLQAIFISEPEVDLGPNIVLCPSQLPITLDVGDTTNTISFLWQDGSTAPQFQVTEDGIYSVTVSNVCFSAVDQVEVTVQDASPVVVLPADSSLCAGQTLTLDGGGVFGDFLWQDSSTTSTFLVHQSGIYSVTITNACGSGSDSITVHYFDSIPALELGPDLSLCPGDTLILYADIPGVGYTWQDSSTADSFIVMSPGIYVLQLANMCNTISDTVVVMSNDSPPFVELPSSVDLCVADTIVIDAGISGVQYLWSDSSQLSTITISDPGLYSITVSNACGVDADTVVIVDAGPAPTVSLNDALSICPDEVILLSPLSSDVLTWLWHNGSTDSTYNIIDSGLVTVQVSNHCGVAHDTMQISLLPSLPYLELGVDTSLCPGEVITFSINIPGVNILWPDGSSGTEYQVTSASLVYATISNQCGFSSDSVDVILLPSAPILNLGPDQFLCPGEIITLSPGLSDVDYLWNDGSTAPFFNTIMPGLIILTVTNTCGSAIDSIEIIENTNQPEVSLGEDILACEGDSVTLSAGISGVNYLWQDGSTAADVTTYVSGTFILQVSNACGIDADTVMVTINGNPPTPSLGSDTVLCEGVTFQLISHADAETVIGWQDGSTLHTFEVTSPGTYILSESNHCGNAADTIVISYEDVPESFELGADTILCPGDFIVLTAPATTAEITWQDGSHNSSIIADQEQLYSLQLSNLCGVAGDDIFISIDEEIPVLNIENQTPWCKDDIITLDATQDFEADYQWNNGITLPSITVNGPGLYAITVTTRCQSIQQEIEVIPGEDCHQNIFIPSVFSPNGDDVNDVFAILIGPSLNVTAVSCSIFDRWGAEIFSTRELNFAWDGKHGNAELLPGVYVYMIRLEYLDIGKLRSKVISGDITLVR